MSIASIYIEGPITTIQDEDLYKILVKALSKLFFIIYYTLKINVQFYTIAV